MSDTKVEEISQKFELGEGPHWDVDQQALFFVDIFGQAFHRYVPTTKEQTTCNLKGDTVSFVIPVEGEPGKYIASHGRKIIIVTWDGKSSTPSAVEEISEIDTVGEAVNNRINDGKCDPFGRLYTGTMGPEPKVCEFVRNRGSLFRWDSTRAKPKTLVSPISLANGLAWNVEKKLMFYIDSLEYRVDQFDYDPHTGDISNRKPLFDFKKNNIPGLPDGMCIDAAGKLWVACFNGSRVIRIDPDTGRLLETIPIPAKQTTSVAFGGPNLDILYVTSAALVEEAKNPEAGKVYQVKGLGVKGLPPNNMKL